MENEETKIAEALETIQDAVKNHRALIRLFKTENGKNLSTFGKIAVELLTKNMTHAAVAALLQITRPAVSTYMRKVENGDVVSALRP